MKLATYKDGSRDGQLLVVSRDLRSAHYATGIASRLQQVLDDWNFLSPQLQDLYEALNAGRARHTFAFDPRQCMAPLPRAYQWLGSAYLSHVEQLGTASAPETPASLFSGPLMYQGRSDDFLGPRDDIMGMREEWGIDFEAEIAAVTGDVPMGCTPELALESVRLLMLANDITLRSLIPDELAKGCGFLRAKPATAFSPVAVTPDELGDAWHGGRVHLAVHSAWNERKVGFFDVGAEMQFHFGQLIAHAAKTRRLRAGTILSGGTVSNLSAEKDRSRDSSSGYRCIAEKRAMEITQDGAAKTGYMKAGDTIRIEMNGKNGESVFGAIEQEVADNGVAS